MTSKANPAAHRVLALIGIFLLGTAAASPNVEHAPLRADKQPRSQPFAGRYLPAGDPNLSPTWDWTVSGTGHTMYYSVNGATPTRLNNVQVPFYTTGHPLATDEKDMYPADGWMLAYRDFGTSTSAPPMPFFVLYNKYRGTLRVMFYNAPNIAYSHYKADLSFRSNTSTGGLMTFTDTAKATLADYDRSRKDSFMGHIAQFRGWAWADFTLFGFDPNLSPDAKFRLDIWGVDEGLVSLESTQFQLTEVLNTSSPGANNSNLFSTLLGAFNAGHKYYKDIEALKKALNDTKSSAPNSWWAGIVSTIVGSQIATAAPYVAGLVGVVKFFLGGKKKAAPREPLNFTGSLKMNGNITTTRSIVSTDFALATGTTAPDFYRPVQTIPWGVFNLTQKPVVNAYGDYMCVDDYGTYLWCEEWYDFTLQAPSYVVNPNVGMTLTSVKTAFTYNGPPSSFVPYNQLGGYYSWREDYCNGDPCYTSESGRYPSGVALELTFRINSPTRYADDEIVVYKEYPPNMNRISP